MAHLLTQKDIYSIMNAMVSDMTGGQATIRAVDTSSFIDCGELVLAQGYENVLNEFGLLLGRIFTAVRPFPAEFGLNEVSTDIFTHRMAKVSYYSKPCLPTSRMILQTARILMMVQLSPPTACGSSITEVRLSSTSRVVTHTSTASASLRFSSSRPSAARRSSQGYSRAC